jgi:hypothetical protein
MASGHEFTPHPEKAPDTQPAFSGGPPQPPPEPPKVIATDLLDPGEPGKRIFLADYIEVAELAQLLGVKPYKVVAALLKMRIFKYPEEFIGFLTAAKIGNDHGFIVERLL